MAHESPPQRPIVILDFGSQYSQLIARRVREQRVYSLLLSHDSPAQEVLSLAPAGVILSGGPASVYEPGAPVVLPYLLEAGLPVTHVAQRLGHATPQVTMSVYAHALNRSDREAVEVLQRAMGSHTAQSIRRERP